jgi:cobalt-zinc-cadmium efflux system outer membrane protein
MTVYKNLILLALPILLAAAGGAGTAPAASDSDTQRELAGRIAEGFSGSVVLGAEPKIEDYIEYAAANNPGLQAAFHDWAGRLERIPSVSSLPEPVFSYMYFGERVETRVGPQRQRFGLRQSFPWFGTLGAREAVAEQESWAAYCRFMSKKLELAYEVRKAYCAYYLLGRRIEITRATLDLMRGWESISSTRFETGRGSRSDIVRIEIEIARLEDALRGYEDAKRPAEEVMRAALGAPDTMRIPLPSVMPAPAVIEADTVMAAISRNNPSILALDHMILREESAVRLVGKSSWPDFSLGFDYIETGPALDPANPDSGKDPWMVSLSLKLPIWIGKNGALRNEAAARLEMKRHGRKDAVSELRARTEKILTEHRDASAKVELYEGTLIPKAEEALAVTLREYEGGETDYLDVLESQRLLLDLKLEFEEAFAAREIKSAELEMLAGRDFRRKPDKED